MAIEIYMRDVNSSEGYLLHTAETVDEVRATVNHVKESQIYAGGESTREVSTQYVVDDNSAYFEIIVG